MLGRQHVPRARGVFSQTFGRHPNFGARATTSALVRRRLVRAFMSRASFAHSNCEYDKKEFLNELQWRKF